MLKTYLNSYSLKTNYLFQHDNVPCNTINYGKEWFKKCDERLQSWPLATILADSKISAKTPSSFIHATLWSIKFSWSNQSPSSIQPQNTFKFDENSGHPNHHRLCRHLQATKLAHAWDPKWETCCCRSLNLWPPNLQSNFKCLTQIMIT